MMQIQNNTDKQMSKVYAWVFLVIRVSPSALLRPATNNMDSRRILKLDIVKGRYNHGMHKIRISRRCAFPLRNHHARRTKTVGNLNYFARNVLLPGRFL
jgi:hypothetical protein